MLFFEFISIFLLIALFFTAPLFGGCLFIILFFVALASFVVFFSLNFIWFALAGGVIYLIYLARKYKNWQKLPDINKYLLSYPECRLAVGVSCNKCGSEKLNNVGLYGTKSRQRFYICSKCGSNLFKFRVL